MEMCRTESVFFLIWQICWIIFSINQTESDRED